MKIVLDTNVYIALALHGEFTEDLFEAITTIPGIKTIISEDIIQEIDQKLQKKFQWNQEEIDLFISKIKTISKVVATTEKLSVISRDPEDNKILECALAGKVNVIVTADQDLIKLKSFKGIAIIHPKTFSWTFPDYFKK